MRSSGNPAIRVGVGEYAQHALVTIREAVGRPVDRRVHGLTFQAFGQREAGRLDLVPDWSALARRELLLAAATVDSLAVRRPDGDLVEGAAPFTRI